MKIIRYFRWVKKKNKIRLLFIIIGLIVLAFIIIIGFEIHTSDNGEYWYGIELHKP